MRTQVSRKKIITLALLHDKYLIDPVKDGSIDDTLKIIRRLGHVQIDTISVVARAHHHILWSRNRSYEPDHLDLLQFEGRYIFEYWAHAAAYLPIEAYPYCLPEMKRVKEQSHDWCEQNDQVMSEVLLKIKDVGPVTSLDFKQGVRNLNTGWMLSKPAKHTLETLFMAGVLAVKSRKNFKKVYDLAEKIYPEIDQKKIPDENAIAENLIEITEKSLGVFSYKDITYLRKNRAVNDAVKDLLEKKVISGKYRELKITDVKRVYYMCSDNYDKLNGLRIKPFIRILSPFDNQVINRERLLDIFGFAYVLECYLPSKKRKAGYFALPVLAHNGFIGAIDLKADRKNKSLLVKQFTCNKELSKTDKNLLMKELHEFALFNKCSLEKDFSLSRRGEKN